MSLVQLAPALERAMVALNEVCNGIAGTPTKLVEHVTTQASTVFGLDKLSINTTRL